MRLTSRWSRPRARRENELKALGEAAQLESVRQKPNMSKSVKDFNASNKLLCLAVELYRSGEIEAYRWVAVELRKLLCDTDSLLPRVHPNFMLHKLHWTELLETMPSLADGMVMMMPGRLHVSPDGSSTFELTFAKSGEMMSASEWINQPFFSPNITIWELVKSVADKEAAHSDPDFNDTLVSAKLVKYVDKESHIPAIVAIGDYLCRWLHDSGLISA